MIDCFGSQHHLIINQFLCLLKNRLFFVSQFTDSYRQRYFQSYSGHKERIRGFRGL